MKIHIKPTFLCTSQIFSLLLLLSLAVLITAQEVDDEHEFDYSKGSKKGPEHWGQIKKEWETCKTGKLQSPIDLLHRRVTVIPKLSEEITVSYRPEKALLKNRGHDIEIKWKDKNSKIQINGTEYILQQSHWHSPSEHTVNRKRFDMELHMVHLSRDNKIAVIGLLYQIGRPNKFLSKLSKKIQAISDTNEETDAGMINPEQIMTLGKNYYRYKGSLTTPPCTEGVLWSVNRRVGTVSEEQVKLLREAVHDHAEKNARPLQPLNERKVQIYAHQIKNKPR